MSQMKIDNDQRVYSTMYRNLSYLGYRSVKTNCEATESAIPGMSVLVAAGTINVGTSIVSVTGGTITIEAADSTYPRWDIIAVNTSGALINPTSANNLKGTPAADDLHHPNDGYDPDSYVVLAMVEVKAGVTSIVNADITDLRTIYSAASNIPSAGTQGRILYDNGSSWVGLAPGLNGQLLKTQGSSANPKWSNVVQDKNQKEINKISVTDVSSSITLSLTDINTLIFINEGSNGCFIDLNASSATDRFYLPASQNITLTDVDFSTISAICNTSETTTLKVLALKGSETGLKTNYEILSISATSTSSYVTFSNTTSYKDIIIINQGANTAYIDFDTAATLNDIKLEKDKSVILENVDYDSISAICDTGDTASIKILAIY